MMVQIVVLIEIFIVLGVEVCWVLCNIFFIQDYVVVVVVVGLYGIFDEFKGVLVFVWKGEMFEEYWWVVEQMFIWLDFDKLVNMIFDDGGDVIMLVLCGMQYEKVGVVLFVEEDDFVEWKIFLNLLWICFEIDKDKWIKIVELVKGVIEEIIIGVLWFY